MAEDEAAKKKRQDELDIVSFMETKRLDRMEEDEIVPITSVSPTILKDKAAEFTYVPSEEEIQYLIDNNPVIKKKAIELVADQSLTKEQISAQLADFIQIENEKALQYVMDSVKKNQKKPRQSTKAQVIAEMKRYCCNVGGWKMAQFKGKSHDEVEGIYYREYSRDKNYAPMGSEKEAEFIKRHAEHMEKSRDRAKKQRIEKSQMLTEDKLKTMVMIEEEDFFPDPLQVRHPIVDWEIHTDENFASTWKLTRLGGETSSFIQFEDLVRSCDRADLDSLWKMVKDRHKADKLQDVKEQELWVHFQTLYEPDPSDRFWKFQAYVTRTLWKFYDSCSIHHVSTEEEVDVFMFAEKEYPLRAGVLTIMLSAKLRCVEITAEIEDLLQRIADQESRETEALKRR